MRTTHRTSHVVLPTCCALALSSACGSSSQTAREPVDATENPSEVVLLALHEDSSRAYYTDAVVCSTAHAPVPLGLVDDATQSPDGRYLAAAREGSVDIVTLSDGGSITLPTGATLAGLRWSQASDRLAFIADGAPVLAAPDGSKQVLLDVPESQSPTAIFEQAEWSSDGRRVAFVTGGLGIVAGADGANARVFSESMVGPYGTPWGVAFSPDGKYLAGLETTEPAGKTRAVIVLELDTFTTRRFEDIPHYSLTGFLADSSAFGLWDVGARLWLIPTGAGEPQQFGNWGTRQSPVTREVALAEPGLPILNLDDGTSHELLPDGTDVQGVVWSLDAEIIGYLAVSSVSSGYLWTADGKRITDRLGIMRDDGWVALPDSGSPTGVDTLDLRGDPSVSHHFRMLPATKYAADGYSINTSNVAWLLDGRLAYLSADGLHVAAKDGSTNKIAGPAADYLVPLQGPRL
jgi:hypothetical protein